MVKHFLEKLVSILSVCYILAACSLLIVVCTHCCPELGAIGKKLIVGREDSPAREAFFVLTDSLEQGNSIKETVSGAYEVLFG